MKLSPLHKRSFQPRQQTADLEDALAYLKTLGYRILFDDSEQIVSCMNQVPTWSANVIDLRLLSDPSFLFESFS